MKIKSYSKQELAMLYFPNLSPHAAVSRLRRWIRHNPELNQALETSAIGKNAKFYTKRQVELIVEYLCEP